MNIIKFLKRTISVFVSILFSLEKKTDYAIEMEIMGVCQI